MIIYNYPSIQHLLNNYSSTFLQFQSIMLSMMCAYNLNSQMQCDIIHQEII